MSLMLVKPRKPAGMQLVDGSFIDPFRPTVVVGGVASVYISRGHIDVVLPSLKVGATDKAFSELFYSKTIMDKANGDDKKREELAVEAFAKKYAAGSTEPEADVAQQA